MLPEGAVFEDQPAGGVAIYNVTDVLPIHKKKKYKERDAAQIIRVYNHHSGKDGAVGFGGLNNSAKYAIKDKKRKVKGKEKIQKGWAGFPYTYWYCFEPDIDDEGRIVIYRANLDTTVSYHTGRKANHHGVGIGWQGNLTKKPPSDAQIEMMEAHFPLLIVQHELVMDDRPFSYHAEAGEFGGKAKPTCPGPFVTELVVEYRDKITVRDMSDEAPEVVEADPPPAMVADAAETVVPAGPEPAPAAPMSPVAAEALARAERMKRQAKAATERARRG